MALTRGRYPFDLQDKPFVDVREYGAVGDGVTDDTAAFQAAFSAASSSGQGGVFVPDPSASYLLSNLQLPDDLTLFGVSRETTHLIGDGVNPILLLGDGTGNLRKNCLKNLRLSNNGATCILGDFAPNWTIDNCWIASDSLASGGAIDLSFCFRGLLKNSVVSASGGAWAFRSVDNCNGIALEGNTITGGSSGGGVLIEQSQSVNITGNILESMVTGISVASTTETGAGLCNAVNITGNYLEQITNPILLGTQNIVRGGECSNNYIGNSVISVIAPRDSSIVFGRIQNFLIENNSIYPHTTENVFEMAVESASGQIENNRIVKNRIQGTPLSVYSITGAFGANASVLRTIGSTNNFDFMSSLVNSDDIREYISPTFTANVSVFPAVAYLRANNVVLGGEVLSVEIIDAIGTLTGCLVRVGRTGNTIETTDQDISLLSFSNGAADVPILVASPSINASEDNTVRITAGSGAGTFRVRIRYRAV